VANVPFEKSKFTVRIFQNFQNYIRLKIFFIKKEPSDLWVSKFDQSIIRSFVKTVRLGIVAVERCINLI